MIIFSYTNGTSVGERPDDLGNVVATKIVSSSSDGEMIEYEYDSGLFRQQWRPGMGNRSEIERIFDLE